MNNLSCENTPLTHPLPSLSLPHSESLLWPLFPKRRVNNKAGLSEVEIQLLGRWKYVTFKNYIDTDHADLILLARHLHGYSVPISLRNLRKRYTALEFSLAAAIASLRSSTHFLNVERLRRVDASRRIERSERRCPHCADKIQDERHALM
jgi:hypothetical protein